MGKFVSGLKAPQALPSFLCALSSLPALVFASTADLLIHSSPLQNPPAGGKAGGGLGLSGMFKGVGGQSKRCVGSGSQAEGQG